MKFSTLFVLPFFILFAAAEPVPVEGREVEARSEAATAAVRARVTADALNCRACPRTNCHIERVYRKGRELTVQCAVNRHTTRIYGNPWWARTSDGCWVSEYYIKFNGPYPPRCSGY